MSIWNHLWKLKIHDRLKLFIWRMLAQVILTRYLMNRRFGLREIECPSYGMEVEMNFHLLKECHTIRVVAFASKWGFGLDKLTVTNLEEWLKYSSNPPGMTESERIFCMIFLITLM